MAAPIVVKVVLMSDRTVMFRGHSRPIDLNPGASCQVVLPDLSSVDAIREFFEI